MPSQLSTDSPSVVSGTEIEALAFPCVSYTARAVDEPVLWSVWASNEATFQEEFCLLGWELVNPGQGVAYYACPAPFGWYRIRLQSEKKGKAGMLKVSGLGKLI